MNDRIGVQGDYQTPEQFIPSGIPTKSIQFNAVDTSIQQELKAAAVPRPEDFQLWETCMTINNTWAYNMHDHEFKSAQFLIRALVLEQLLSPGIGCACGAKVLSVPLSVSRIYPETPDSDPSDRSADIHVVLRQEPDEEEDEEEDEGDRKEDDEDEDTDDGYSE